MRRLTRTEYIALQAFERHDEMMRKKVVESEVGDSRSTYMYITLCRNRLADVI